MPDGHRSVLSPSGRQLAKVACLLLAIALMPALGRQGDQPGDQQANPSAEGNAGKAEAPAPRNIMASATGATNPDQRQAEDSRYPAVRWMGWLVSVLDRYANLLIMFFTGLLLWVAYLQNRLETRLAADTGDALDVARRSANAASSLATAAAEANKLTKDLFIAEQRPHVSLESIDLKTIQITETGSVAMEIAVAYRNRGKTAASKTAVLFKTFPYHNGISTGSVLAKWMVEAARAELPKWPIRTLVMAGDAAVEGRHIHLPKDEVDRVDFGDRFVFGISGCLYYEMAATASHFFTGFTIVVSYLGDKANIAGPARFLPLTDWTMHLHPGDDIRN